MDIRKAAIYELPMSGAAMKYASEQKYATTRGNKSILVISEEAPKMRCRKLKEDERLNGREIEWAFSAIAEIARGNSDSNAHDNILKFLSRFEKEMEKKMSEKGGENNGG